jgi:hypothetical protein
MCSTSPGNPSIFLNRTHAFRYSQFFTAITGVAHNGDIGVVPPAINCADIELGVGMWIDGAFVTETASTLESVRLVSGPVFAITLGTKLVAFETAERGRDGGVRTAELEIGMFGDLLAPLTGEPPPDIMISVVPRFSPLPQLINSSESFSFSSHSRSAFSLRDSDSSRATPAEDVGSTVFGNSEASTQL